jgi:Family of unknown function (DUF6460)
MAENDIARLLGGRPASVAVKLLIISIIVGAVLHFVGLSPAGLIRGLGRMIESLIGSGWDAIRSIGEFALYGAMIVIPVWLVGRMLSSRKQG